MISCKTLHFLHTEAMNGGKTLQKAPEKHCNETSANFLFQRNEQFSENPGR